MKHAPLSLTIMAALAVALAACGQASEEVPVPATEEQAAPTPHYEAVGVVVSFMAEKKFVNISHKAIAGFMDAMTMPFEVKDTTLLRDIQEGDSITFRFTIADGIQAIDKIE